MNSNFCYRKKIICNYFVGIKKNAYLCSHKVGSEFIAHKNNSTRLAYRKICWRVILLYILWQIKSLVPFKSK